MKINIKKQVLEMMQTLYEGIHYIKVAPDDERIEFLQQCITFKAIIQDAVIKEVQEKNTILAMFNMYDLKIEELKKCINDTVLKNNIIDLIMAKLEEIYDYLLNEISTEKQVAVFLPYKASMWDAFDSIYKAVLEDEEWEAIIMPIPYFNINREKEILATHYEGNQLPEYVEVTDYRRYNLELEKPDVIFISNPYDDRNIITQVPKEYFSSELKKYTSRLVYIPYFITGGSVDAHFTILPGVWNSWRTFVENEEARESYIKFNHPDKIVALGSPKNDRISQMHEEDGIILEEWREKIADKCVFMYNSHLRSIMVRPKAFIDKLRYIIEIFSREEKCAIVWRPHPLALDTIKSTSPHIEEEYLELVEKFKLLKNGIYDDTADLSRTIHLSNAYIGDGTSSVVSLYKQSGKPMFIFNLDNYITNEEDEKILHFSAGTVIERELYFSATNFNALFKMHLDTGKIEYCGLFEGEAKIGMALHKDVVQTKEYLYFIPGAGRYITALNKKNREIKQFKFEEGKYSYHKFATGHVVEDELWVFPNMYDAIVKINLVSEEIEYYRAWYDDMRSYIKADQDLRFEGAQVIGNTVWMACRQSNVLLSFDLITKVHRIFEVGTAGNTYKNLAHDGSKFWLINSSHNSIAIWNPNDNQIKVLEMVDDYGNTVSVLNLFYIEGYIWGILNDDKRIIKIDIKDYRIEWLNEDNQVFSFINARQYGANFAVAYEKDKAIYFSQMAGNGIVKIDMETKKIDILTTKIDTELLNQVWENLKDDAHNIFQEKAHSLPRILNLIQTQKEQLVETKFESQPKEQSAGENIWKYITEQI